MEAQAPVGLAYSSYYGQFQHDEATDIAVDGAGFVYVTGAAESWGLGTGFDAFVVKLTPDGSQIVYSTYLRGSGFDIATALAVDATGAVYVVGHTTSTDFPLVTPFQSALNGSSDMWIAKLDASGTLVTRRLWRLVVRERQRRGSDREWRDLHRRQHRLDGFARRDGPQQTFGGGFDDGFAAKIRADGTGVDYATYLGGSAGDSAFRLAVDAAGHAYIAGQTSSADFPVAAALQPAFGGGFNDGFVTKLCLTGRRSCSRHISVASIGMSLWPSRWVRTARCTSRARPGRHNFPTVNAYQPFLAGGFTDAFLATIQPDGQALTFSTFLGGHGGEAAISLIVDGQGNLHLGGDTDSFDFPAVAPIQEQVNGTDGFVAQFSQDGQMLLQSTPFGGTGLDVVVALGLSPAGELWFAGRTDSADLPVVNPVQPWHGGASDAFIARLGIALPPNQAPVADAGDDILATASGCFAQIAPNGSRSGDPDGDLLSFEWLGEFGIATGAAPTVQLKPGTHDIVLRVHDGRGGSATDTVQVTVSPDAPPRIGRASATPNVLSPADHQMVPVQITVDLAGGCVPSTTCQIVSVSSSEPDSGLGRSDLAPDWEITGPLTLRLRAEHSPRSIGRIYAIVVECTHAGGGTTRTIVFVTVPRH